MTSILVISGFIGLLVFVLAIGAAWYQKRQYEKSLDRAVEAVLDALVKANREDGVDDEPNR